MAKFGSCIDTRGGKAKAGMGSTLSGYTAKATADRWMRRELRRQGKAEARAAMKAAD